MRKQWLGWLAGVILFFWMQYACYIESFNQYNQTIPSAKLMGMLIAILGGGCLLLWGVFIFWGVR